MLKKPDHASALDVNTATIPLQRWSADGAAIECAPSAAIGDSAISAGTVDVLARSCRDEVEAATPVAVIAELQLWAEEAHVDAAVMPVPPRPCVPRPLAFGQPCDCQCY